MFGIFPARTPLNPRVTGVVERPEYRIEKILFESRPGCFVSGNLYLPAGAKGPFPGTLIPCGHSGNGKAYPSYQTIGQRLAQAGFAAFIYDPFNQGERDQYFGVPGADPVQKNCCHAHNLMGKQLELFGEFFGSWRAWDGIRALDYLISRPEVDGSRIGLTGNSGGGTMTTWLWALDGRFTMAAPSCFVTDYRSNLDNELPADCEQYPPDLFGKGFDIADFFLARAPEPVVILAEEFDFFDIRGTRRVFEEVRRFYRLFGAEEDVRLWVGNSYHRYPPQAQDTMAAFFRRHAGIKGVSRPPVVREEKDEILWAAPEGQVLKAPGAVPIHAMIAQKAREADAGRKCLSAVELRKSVRTLLHVPKAGGVPSYRHLRGMEWDGFIFQRFAVETEPGIEAIVREQETTTGTFMVPEKKTVLFVPHLSFEDEWTRNPEFKRCAQQGKIWSVDVRGFGESLPDEQGDFFAPYGADYMYHGWSLMLGESYFGRRVYDLLRVFDLLRSKGMRGLDLRGRGNGALIALFAAVLDNGIETVSLSDLPCSFSSLACTPLTPWPSASFPWGVLKKFDIPDCLRLIGKKGTVRTMV